MSEILTAFGINWKLLLAQMINFGVLLIALGYLVYRPILKMLDERREKIKQGVMDADKASKKLESAEEERKEIVGKASNKAEEIVLSAKERAEEKKTEIVIEAQKRAESILEDAAVRAEETQKKVMKETEAEIAKTAILAAEKVLRGNT